MRQMNEVAVMSCLRERGSASRTDVARETGLSLATVSAVASRLLGLALIEEHEVGESSGGRPPVMLAIRPGAAHVCGIKLTERAATGVMVDLAGSIVAQATVRTDDGRPESVVGACRAVLAQLADRAEGRRALAVGIGIAGTVDWESGTVRVGTYRDWRHVPLRESLETALELPVVVDNDVNALLSAEQLFGVGKSSDDFCMMTVGRGIGLGLVLSGSVYRGSFGGAGELGHTKVADGPTCVCGAEGCLEAVVGDEAIVARVSADIGRRLTMQEVTAWGRGGNEAARAAFAQRGTLLGRAAGNLVNVLNPDSIVLAGDGTNAADLFLPAFRSALAQAAFGDLGDRVDIHVRPWDDLVWARGAACLVLNEMFAPNFSARGNPVSLLPTDLVG